MNFKKLFSQSDYIGITASVACLLHCLLSPFLMGALFYAQETESFINLEYIFLIISVFSVWQSTRHQHSKLIQSILWFSLSLLVTSVLLEEYASFFEYLVYLAGIGLATGHWLNIRLCQKSFAH